MSSGYASNIWEIDFLGLKIFYKKGNKIHQTP